MGATPGGVRRDWLVKGRGFNWLPCGKNFLEEGIGSGTKKERGGGVGATLGGARKDCGYFMTLGIWLLALGSRRSALGSRLLAFGSWLSALGVRLLALGSRLSALGSQLSAFGSISGSRRPVLFDSLTFRIYFCGRRPLLFDWGVPL